MKKSPSFSKPILPSNKMPSFNTWQKVLDLYDEKKYQEAILRILDYINPSIQKKFGNQEKNQFVIPHGSVVVTLTLKDDIFSAKAPFLKVPKGSTVPLLRQVAEINFSPLNLVKIILEENHLTFYHNLPVELCEPNKTYGLLKEICLFADRYDDEFIENFGATHLVEPVVKNIDGKILESVWKKTQDYLNETSAYIEFFERKSHSRFVYDTLILCFFKIDNLASPKGVLQSKIETAVDKMQRDIPFQEKIQIGKDFFNVLRGYKKEDFLKNIYEAETFIPFKGHIDTEGIKKYLEYGYKFARDELNKGDQIGAILTIQFYFLNLMYQYNLPTGIFNTLRVALVQASNKTWDQASFILWETMELIMGGKISSYSIMDFFKYIFGRK